MTDFPGDLPKGGFPFDDERRKRVQRAMRLNDQLFRTICSNMLAGRESFFGTAQFIEDKQS